MVSGIFTYVYEREKGGADHCGKPGDSSNGTLLEDSGRDSGVILLPKLNANKDNEQNSKNDQKCDDAAVGPWVLRAAPLESEKQADDHRQEDDRAVDIELLDVLAPASVAKALCAGLLGGVVEEHDEGDGHRADWEVDVEAPAPRELVGEGSSHKRTSHRSNAVHATNQAHVCGTLAKRNGGCDDEDGSGEDTGRPDTCNGAPDNQGSGVGSCTADCAADFEDGQGCQVDPLDREKGV